MLLVVTFSVIFAATLSYALYVLATTNDLQMMGAVILGLLLQVWVARLSLNVGKTTHNPWLNPNLISSKTRSLAFVLPTSSVLAIVGIIEGFDTLIGAVQLALAVILVAMIALIPKTPRQTEQD